MILQILNPRQKNACTQDPLCALVAFLNIHCFPKLCGLYFSRVVFMSSSSTKSCVFQFAIQLFGNLAILVFLFCLGSDTSLPGLHKLCYPTIRDRSTWSKFGAHGEHGDVFLFSNLSELWFSENLIRYSLHVCLREVKNNLFSFKHSYSLHFSWQF